VFREHGVNTARDGIRRLHDLICDRHVVHRPRLDGSLFSVTSVTGSRVLRVSRKQSKNVPQQAV
jgi:hypothetical protein